MIVGQWLFVQAAECVDTLDRAWAGNVIAACRDSGEGACDTNPPAESP
jgi:hypothetical protein